MKIKIVTDSTGPVEAMLDERSPVTAAAIWGALPIEARAST